MIDTVRSKAAIVSFTKIWAVLAVLVLVVMLGEAE